MSDMPFLTPHFWLLLVLYPGVAGALYFHIKLKRLAFAARLGELLAAFTGEHVGSRGF